jgi:hypothetical protein
MIPPIELILNKLNAISRHISISILHIILSPTSLSANWPFPLHVSHLTFCINFHLSRAYYILFTVLIIRKDFHCGALQCSCLSSLLLDFAHHSTLKYPQSIYIPPSGWKPKFHVHIKEPAKLQIFIRSRVCLSVYNFNSLTGLHILKIT